MHASVKGKIINDPVYGFIRFPEPELMMLIEHPWFQRLRRIKQMGMAYLVYPGAVHSRFHHSLGACHLMGKALDELRAKGIALDNADCLAARMAILLHDVGHGPFSHALEHLLVSGLGHEKLSMMIMQRLNAEMGGMLTHAIQVFDHAYPQKFLHQLVSSQLDVDRMDYLNRDSFYTGVSEGVIGYDRILQMLTVRNQELMVEEKGVHSVEKFIIARRLMYWQVYLHKTVLGAEELLINILKRARELARDGQQLFASPALHHFLYQEISEEAFLNDPVHLNQFCQLDDADILVSIKVWQQHADPVLSLLCRMMIDRRLYKVRFTNDLNILEDALKRIRNILPITEEHLSYFGFAGTTSSSTYNVNDERICIALKDGSARDISEVEHALVNQALAMPVHKNYICFYPA